VNSRTSYFASASTWWTVVALVLFVLGFAVWATAEVSPWGRMITSAAIVSNSATHKIYAVNEGASSITVIDAATGVERTVAVGSEPIAIAVNRKTNRIYVANDGSASVSVIDGSNDTVISTVPCASLPYTLAADETTNRVYVTHTYSGSMTVIDGASNTATSLEAGDADGLAVDSKAGKVFLSTYEDPNIRIVDEASGAVTKVAVGAHIWGMVFDESSSTLFLTHTVTGEIVALDGKTHAVTTLSVGKIPCALAINPKMRRLYVVNYGDETLSVIDLENRSVIATLPVGKHPQGVAVDARSNKVFVANVHGDNVTVIDGVKNAVIDVRDAGRHPYGVAVDPSTDHAYAANYGPPWVTPIALDK